MPRVGAVLPQGTFPHQSSFLGSWGWFGESGAQSPVGAVKPLVGKRGGPRQRLRGLCCAQTELAMQNLSWARKSVKKLKTIIKKMKRGGIRVALGHGGGPVLVPRVLL